MRKLDFVFLIDSTEGMQPCISALKENVSLLFESFGGIKTDWRGKVIAYRDISADGDRWFEDNIFVTDVNKFNSQLNKLEVIGGDGNYNSALDALYKVASMPTTKTDAENFSSNFWRSKTDRIICLFTKSLYCSDMIYDEFEGGNIEDVINVFQANRITLILYAPDHDLWYELVAMKAEYHIPNGVESDSIRAILSTIPSMISRGCSPDWGEEVL